jgi:hypothetical protein
MILLYILGIYPKERKSAYNRDTGTPMFIAAPLTIAKLWNRPTCPSTGQWIQKMWHKYTINNGVVFSHKEALCQL